MGEGIFTIPIYNLHTYMLNRSGVTVSAVSHRIRRIKDKAKNSGLPIDETGDDNNNTNNTASDTAKSPAGTPVKGKRGRKPAATGKTEGPAAKKLKGGDVAKAVSAPVSTSGPDFAEEGGDDEDAGEV